MNANILIPALDVMERQIARSVYFVAMLYRANIGMAAF